MLMGVYLTFQVLKQSNFNMDYSRSDESTGITVPQRVRYFVRDVIDFSSQYGKEHTSSYTVSNIRSRPHYYPKYGDFLESCVLVGTVDSESSRELTR